MTYVPFCGLNWIVITDMDCFGNVTTSRRAVGIDLLSTFVAGPESVCISARAAGVTPSKVIVVEKELVRLVFTAFMKIVLPRRLAAVSTSGELTVVESRTSP